MKQAVFLFYQRFYLLVLFVLDIHHHELLQDALQKRAVSQNVDFVHGIKLIVINDEYRCDRQSAAHFECKMDRNLIGVKTDQSIVRNVE